MKAVLLPVALCCAVTLAFGAGTMQTGKVTLKSAGALAVGPDGVLLVGDSVGAAIYALDVNDRTAANPTGTLEVKGVNEKIAAMLGTAADQILIQDIVVNPASKNVYMAVSRGKGANAIPIILRVDTAGKISEVSLENIRHASVSLGDAPAQDRQRLETITQLKYVDGKVLVA